MLPRLSEAELNEGIFIGPDIRKVMKDTNVVSKLNTIEKKARLSFVEVTKKILGNTKSANYKEIVSRVLQNCKVLGSNMSLRIHFLDSHLDFFQE